MIKKWIRSSQLHEASRRLCAAAQPLAVTQTYRGCRAVAIRPAAVFWSAARPLFSCTGCLLIFPGFELQQVMSAV